MDGSCQGLGGGVGSYLRGTDFHLGKIKKLRSWTVVMVVQQCEFISCHQTVLLKMVNMVYVIFILL